MTTYQNYLEINHHHKPIPYGGFGEVRDDGEANHGFKYVKGNDAALCLIPELARDAVLLELARSINAPETGLFSVGCLSLPVNDANGFRHSGYMEFAFNSCSAIADASNYFPVYFHFDRGLYKRQFPTAVSFYWQLQPCTFTEADATGFTCAITLNTHCSPTQEAALSAWDEALCALGSYLRSVPAMGSDYIYP